MLEYELLLGEGIEDIDPLNKSICCQLLLLKYLLLSQLILLFLSQVLIDLDIRIVRHKISLVALLATLGCFL